MPIQVMNIFRESFKHFKENKISWLRIAFAPIMLYILGYILLITAFISVGHPLRPHEIPTGFWPIFAHIMNFFLSIIAGVSLCINGYRYGILGEGGETWWHLQFNTRFVRVILYGLLIGVLAGLYVLFSAGLIFAIAMSLQMTVMNVILGVLLGLFGIYILFRLSLTLALISIDREHPLSTSWHMLKGNVLRLFGLVLLIALKIVGIFLLGFIVIGLIAALLHFIAPILAIVFSVIVGVPFLIYLWLLNWAVVAKAVSLVYLSFTEGEA